MNEKHNSMNSKIITFEKKIHDKKVELVLIEFKKICKSSERVINNIIKGNDLDSKPRVKCKSHTKGNTN